MCSCVVGVAFALIIISHVQHVAGGGSCSFSSLELNLFLLCLVLLVAYYLLQNIVYGYLVNDYIAKRVIYIRLTD
jgi:hypothetical protein